MAACGSLQHIFENPLPENPTLLESLTSWNKMKSISPPIEQSSFTEIFGELHFKENSQSSSPLPISSSSSSPSSFCVDFNPQSGFDNLLINKSTSLNSYMNSNGHRNSDIFSSMNSESLQLCTEGLGFESCDDVEECKSDVNMYNWKSQEDKNSKTTVRNLANSEKLCGEMTRKSPRRSIGSVFPPPISCIGKSGKPWMSLKSYRQDGRFVLKEVRIPTQEFLHACRQDGRLKLHFVLPEDDEVLEEDDEDSEEDGDDDHDHETGEIGSKTCTSVNKS